MTDFALLLASIGFAILISGDLAASYHLAWRVGYARLLQALDVVFWSSWVGLIITPICIVLRLLNKGIGWTERIVLAAVSGIIVTILFGLAHAKSRERYVRQDVSVESNIDRDKASAELARKLRPQPTSPENAS